jgi:predicted ABC-type ATPase
MARDASSRPNLIVLGGPNGAGKSTVAPMLLRDELEVREFVNADTIATGLSGFGAEGAAMEAGRIMLQRIRTLAQSRVDFAFESTLASRSLGVLIREAREKGYRSYLVFLWLEGPDLAVARVRERVRSGGHSVPEETIRRRYCRGVENFFRIYRPLADRWRFYDNSGTSVPRLIARGGAGEDDEIIDGATWRRARPSE